MSGPWISGTTQSMVDLDRYLLQAAQNTARPSGVSAQQLVDSYKDRLVIEIQGFNPKAATYTLPRDSPSGCTGQGQFAQVYLDTFAKGTTQNQIRNGEVSVERQSQIGMAGWASYMATVQKTCGVTDPKQLSTLTSAMYNLGPDGFAAAVAPYVSDKKVDYAAALPALNSACVAANGKSLEPKLSFVAEAPFDAVAVPYSPVRPDVAGIAPMTQSLADYQGLDTVPWWKMEGVIIGNPSLRRVPDAISFLIQLPPRSTGQYLTTKKGGSDRVIIRLNTGLTSFSSGSSHQNSVQPTGSGLLLTICEARPDIIQASGTTGVFMNQFGLTALMSTVGDRKSALFSAIARAYGQSADARHVLRTKLKTDNYLRVAAQDAFMELLALFKNNGLVRYVQPQITLGGSVAGNALALSPMGQRTQLRNESAWVAGTGLTGYQARHRVGDVMNSGYVTMIYKGRIIKGQFKAFDWTANADSPFRWDFNFTFRVMSDFVPYTVGIRR